MTEARLAVPLPQPKPFVEEPETEGGLHLGYHPSGGAIGSKCPVCNYIIAPFNSARFCHCNVSSHYKCIMHRLRGANVEDHRKCEICGTSYILYFQERAALRPLRQCSFWRCLFFLIWVAMVALLCLILVDVFSHALEDGQSIYEEYSYLLFAGYTGIFVVVTLGCCTSIIFEQKSTLVRVEPYRLNIESYFENAGDEGKDLVNGTSSASSQVDETQAKAKPVERQQQPTEKAD